MMMRRRRTTRRMIVGVAEMDLAGVSWVVIFGQWLIEPPYFPV